MAAFAAAEVNDDGGRVVGDGGDDRVGDRSREGPVVTAGEEALAGQQHLRAVADDAAGVACGQQVHAAVLRDVEAVAPRTAPRAPLVDDGAKGTLANRATAEVGWQATHPLRVRASRPSGKRGAPV